MSRASSAFAAALAVYFLVLPNRAHAHGIEGSYAMLGLSLGARFGSGAPTGFFLGVEGSFVHLGEAGWYGGYADIVHDFGNSATRVSLGPEGGFLVAGIDGGVVFEKHDGNTRIGYALRPMFTAGLLTSSLRFEGFPGSEDESGNTELGFLLKFPVYMVDYGVSPLGNIWWH